MGDTAVKEGQLHRLSSHAILSIHALGKPLTEHAERSAFRAEEHGDTASCVDDRVMGETACRRLPVPVPLVQRPT